MSIEERYLDTHAGSAKLHAKASQVLPNGVTHDARHLRPFPVYVERAAGSKKWDVDGHEYVDYVMGHGALLLGHSHPVVAEAAMRQLPLGTHYGASHALEAEWAEEVVRLVPSAEVVRFTSSGTEATLMALRLARAATGRPGLLKFERHFHGWHDYVIGTSTYGAAAPVGVPEATLESVAVVPPDMAVVRETLAGRPDIGAVIVEASGASSGAVPLARGFLKELESHLRAQGIIFIMDEVVTGFRWSVGGVQLIEGVMPDITALAKVLAGGFPGGAVAGRRDLMERLEFPAPGVKADKIGHPGTFNANPLSSAAGVACLREIADGTHQGAADARAKELRAGMNTVLAELGMRGAIYGESSVFKILLGVDCEPLATDRHGLDLPPALLERGTPSEVSRQMQLSLLNRGVFFFGNAGIVSSAHTSADIAHTIDSWRSALQELRAEGIL